LRYAIQPYLYTEARRTYDTGVAFVHPLYYDWPKADDAFKSGNEYMFGDELLVSPIVEPSDKVTRLAKEDVWLPEGNWVEWPTGKRFAGPVTIERSFSLEQIPVYVKAGSIIPTQPDMQYTGQKPVDPLVLNVWPLAQGAKSNYSVYEDSGASVDYQRGIFARTPITAAQDGDSLRVEIGPVEGSYPGMLRTRSYQLRLPDDWPPATVLVNGRPIAQGQAGGSRGWTFDGNTLTTVIPTSAFSTSERVTIEVRRAAGLTARRGELDGFAGAIARLRGAYDALQQTWPVAQPPDALIDAAQRGDRLSYHPEHAVEEITHFHDVLPKAQAAVKNIGSTFADQMERYAKGMENNPLKPADMDAQKQSRADSMNRAVALVNEAGR
jgi:alpha-glucosidase